ncbi:hypothetical protein EVAR_19988_1 [Eumeta japonica]|uniref:Uncharacterized protein n=1 Tax=Eumeta variegata TaxID=151549 RepID=A0A4C1V9E1_EUMVA|nr:hypothetical protein EVAR_19988_1 [Eumeta japonica]
MPTGDVVRLACLIPNASRRNDVRGEAPTSHRTETLSPNKHVNDTRSKQQSGRKVVGVNRSIRQLKARRYRRDITQAPVSARAYKLRLCANGACPLKICTTLSSRRTSLLISSSRIR